jgi:hypothetical protein
MIQAAIHIAEGKIYLGLCTLDYSIAYILFYRNIGAMYEQLFVQFELIL